MSGVLLGATFSYGCGLANELGLTPMLKEYTDFGGKSHSEEKIRAELKKLISYLYYRLITLANNIDDPFDLRVIRAHWIGNELLENIKPIHLKQLFETKEWDEVLFAYVLEPVIKGKPAHHNFYATHKNCAVTTDGQYLYHLGEKRIRATRDDLKNLAKYGGGK